MTFEALVDLIGTVPFMPPERGKLIYEFIRSAKPEHVLELGFAHGTSSCYMAAAMQENGGGMVHTIDNRSAMQRSPSITELLDRSGLGDFVSPVFTERSYNWELMKLLEQQTTDGVTRPLYDFAFIDGGHTWDSDGFAFLLADRLLKPGGWLLLDDVMWTPSESAGEEWVDAMPQEERGVAHVEKILKLLVLPHPSYTDFEFDGHWAWARKRDDDGAGSDSGRTHALISELYDRTDAARKSYKYRRYVRKLFRL